MADMAISIRSFLLTVCPFGLVGRNKMRQRDSVQGSLPDELVHRYRVHVLSWPELDVPWPQALFDEAELPIQPNCTGVRGKDFQADLFDQRFSRGPCQQLLKQRRAHAPPTPFLDHGDPQSASVGNSAAWPVLKAHVANDCPACFGQ